MDVRELRCPTCFAPIDPSRGAVSRCVYCGVTLFIDGANVAPAPLAAMTPGKLHLEKAGPNLIAVIKTVRENTGLGLKPAKDLVESAPCEVADWDDPARLEKFRAALVAAGAKVR
jgi:large subunit ribosomal protein L7/L12